MRVRGRKTDSGYDLSNHARNKRRILPPPPSAPPAPERPPELVRAMDARSRKLESDARLAEARTHRYLGAMVPTDIAIGMFNTVLRGINTSLSSMVSRLAVAAVGVTDMKQALVEMGKIVDDVRAGIVEMEPGMVHGERYSSSGSGQSVGARSFRADREDNSK